MLCKDAGTLIHPYLDGELDRSARANFEAHVEQCPACTAELDQLASFGQAIRRGVPHYRAPAGLADRVRRNLAGQAVVRTLPRPWVTGRRQWMAWAASLVVAVAASSTATYWATLATDVPDARQRLVEDLVSSHIRALMSADPVDVASSDQHTVKPWFAGKLDLSPPVVDLADKGYALVGGRLDVIGERPVAALVYRHEKHVIDVYALPDAGRPVTAQEMTTQHGYNLVHWSAGGLSLWAVSDLNARELGEFVRLLQSQS